MTRPAARELAVLITASLRHGEDPAEAVERFFEPEHYASLSSEGAQFAEKPGAKQLAYICALVGLAAEHRGELDLLIGEHAHGWRAARLSRSVSAILRCALCEILYLPDIPPRAAINEAVELAKRYEGDEGRAFVNGVLGGFMRARERNTGDTEAHPVEAAAAETGYAAAEIEYAPPSETGAEPDCAPDGMGSGA